MRTGTRSATVRTTRRLANRDPVGACGLRPRALSREASDRERLSPRRQPLPATERLSLLRRQRLSAPLLPDRAAGSQTEIEIVEDLGGLVGHESQSIAC